MIYVAQLRMQLERSFRRWPVTAVLRGIIH